MTPSGSLYRRARAAAYLTAVLAIPVVGAQIPPDAEWRGQLAMARKTVAKASTQAKPAAPPAKKIKVAQATPPAAKAASSETLVKLSEAYHGYLRTKFMFNAGGWNVWASAGIDPDRLDENFMILQVEDKKPAVFDIKALVTATKPRLFSINKIDYILEGKLGFPPESESVINLHRNLAKDQGKDPIKEPVWGDKMLSFKVLDFRKGIYEAGVKVGVEGADVRLFYGDAVTKVDNRLQTGPAKGFAFVQRTGEHAFAKAVMIDSTAVKPGTPALVKVSDTLTLRLELVSEDTLKITKEK